MNLEKSVTRILNAKGVLEPLPTTRELGDRFKVSHVTVSRVLRRMVDSGVLWQAHSGRFYRAEAEAQLARPRPVGCLVRSLSAWAAWYEGIMAGVGRACEQEGRGILVHPVSDLVQQSGPDESPRFLSEKKQREVLGRYLDRHPKETERLLLDDTWSDVVLRGEADRLGLARMLLRPAPVAGMEACYPDFRQGALLGLSHLLGRGYREIIFVQPYLDMQVSGHMEAAFVEAFASLGVSEATFDVVHSDGASEFPRLMNRIQGKDRPKVALICPEDNFAVVLLGHIREAGLAVPGKVGLLGAMGTKVLNDAGISRLRVDFAALGERAVTGPFPSQGGPMMEFALEGDITT